LAADVADADAMETAFCEIEKQLGSVTGVFHCAGSIGADTFAEIARATRTEAEKQFHAKIYGTNVLAQVLARREAEFCVLTSSLASILGGLGFSAYAAANLYMDAFAQAQQAQTESQTRHPTRWLSINWDAWRIGTIKSAVDGFGGTVSDYYMEPDQAAAACLHLLGLPAVPRAVISTGDLKARLRQWVRGAEASENCMTRQKRSTLPERFAVAETETQKQLVEIWQDLFAIEPIGIDDNFFELGGHSLLATQMNARIASRLGVELSLTSVLATPSVAELAIVVDDAKLEAVDEQAMAAMLAELDGLSDAEINTLLERES
jgi:acyl carrier protein